MRNIEEKVIKVVAESLGVDKEKVTLDATFYDLGADSLDKIELAMDLEQEFNVVLDEKSANLKDLLTVKDVVIIVEKLLEEK